MDKSPPADAGDMRGGFHPGQEYPLEEGGNCSSASCLESHFWTEEPGGSPQLQVHKLPDTTGDIAHIHTQWWITGTRGAEGRQEESVLLIGF